MKFWPPKCQLWLQIGHRGYVTVLDLEKAGGFSRQMTLSDTLPRADSFPRAGLLLTPPVFGGKRFQAVCHIPSHTDYAPPQLVLRYKPTHLTLWDFAIGVRDETSSLVGVSSSLRGEFGSKFVVRSVTFSSSCTYAVPEIVPRAASPLGQRARHNSPSECVHAGKSHMRGMFKG